MMLEIITEILKGIVSIFLYFWWLFALVFAYFAWQNHRKANWVSEQEEVVLEIKIPKTNDKTPTAAEMMFATLHGILRPKGELVRNGTIQEHLSFEITADMQSIRFFVWTPKHLKDFVEGQVYAQYPSAEITIAEDYTKKISDDVIKKGVQIKAAELVLTREDYLPIKTFNNFQVDPLAGITGVLSKLEEKDEQIWIQILARPVSDEWKKRGLNWVINKKGGNTLLSTEDFGKTLARLPFQIIGEFIKAFISSPSAPGTSKSELSAEDSSRMSAIEQKAEKLAFKVKIRTAYISTDPTKSGTEKINAIFGAFKQFNTTMLNGFKGKNIHNPHQFMEDYRNRLFLSNGFYLNIEEIASIYHMPHTSVETPNIHWTTSKTGEPPTTLPTPDNTPEDELTLFAETNFRSHKQVFGIKKDDRCRHMYVIGKSGMGKSKLLENLINKDIMKGEGVAVVDPHGDLIAATLAKIPPERINDVIIFDPSDTQYPIGFNPMEVIDESLKIQIASGVLGTFKKIFGNSWGPRLEYVFNYTLLALLDTPGSTLLGVVNMLTDKNFRKEIIANIKDPVVKKFWTTEWASYSEKFATEAVAPILNKVGQFTANGLIRNIIGQPSSSFNIREAMDEGKILLINLSTGKVGETNAALMGAMMITAIQLAAMSRADVAESERRDFYLYVDEFQNFATESFKVILSEARKYHLALTMANQYVAQMEDTGVKDAIFGNVGTIITFRVGAQDANELAREFNPPFEPQDLINLARQHIYIRMTIDGQSEQAFSAKTLTVNSDSTDVVEDIVKHSRESYTRARAEVEKEIAIATGIEIEAVHYGNSTEVKIKTADGPIIVTETDSVFEAPLVRKVKGKGSNREDSKFKISEAIRENTAHLSNEKEVTTASTPKAEEKPEGQKVTPEKPKDNAEVASEPQKIKDKIDKEILSEILKNVVTPRNTEDPTQSESKEKPINNELVTEPNENLGTDEVKQLGEYQQEQHTPVVKKKSRKRKRNPSERKEEILKDNNSVENPQADKRGVEETEKPNQTAPEPPEAKQGTDLPARTEHTTEETKTNKETTNEGHKVIEHHASPSSREKIITPENFKNIKQIHPHEIVKIVSEDPKDINEGEEIKF